MTTTKVQTGLRLEAASLRKITSIAKREKRSLNAQIEIAVQKHIEEYEASNGAIPVDFEDSDFRTS